MFLSMPLPTKYNTRLSQGANLVWIKEQKNQKLSESCQSVVLPLCQKEAEVEWSMFTSKHVHSNQTAPKAIQTASDMDIWTCKKLRRKKEMRDGEAGDNFIPAHHKVALFQAGEPSLHSNTSPKFLPHVLPPVRDYQHFLS